MFKYHRAFHIREMLNFSGFFKKSINIREMLNFSGFFKKSNFSTIHKNTFSHFLPKFDFKQLEGTFKLTKRTDLKNSQLN